MSCIIQKFGGACFATHDRLLHVARRIVDGEATRRVVVVSARQGVTDLLADQMDGMGGSEQAVARDLMLATGELQSAALLTAAVGKLGGRAGLLAPWLVFRTDSVFGDATILRVHDTPVRDLLDRGIVPIVPGFIGGTADGRVTTLGRGGSDYSAVALGVALSADRVELYKAEVDGVYDADPHTHAEARRFEGMTHAEALRLARAGARVLQEKAAALADCWMLPVLVRPAFAEGPGTAICSPARKPARAWQTSRADCGTLLLRA